MENKLFDFEYSSCEECSAENEKGGGEFYGVQYYDVLFNADFGSIPAGNYVAVFITDCGNLFAFAENSGENALQQKFKVEAIN